MSEGEDRTTVTLGSAEYQIKPQPYPRLFRQLSEFGEDLQSLGEMDTTDAGSLVAALGGRVYAFLRIFIGTQLMAEHRFAGYASKEAMEAGEFDPDSEAEAPTLPQIIDAIETGIAVNGGKKIGGLMGKLLGPEMGQQVQRLVAATLSERLAQGSMNSPSPSDGATPNGSTPASPTPDGDATPTAPFTPGPANVASPSLVSSP